MSSKDQAVNTSTSTPSTLVPHMDGCPCSDQARHFPMTPGLEAYLRARPSLSDRRFLNKDD